MLNRLIVASLLLQLTLLMGCGGRTETRPTSEESSRKRSDENTGKVVTDEDPLPFEIVEQNRVKKGGSIDPLLAPKYVLYDVKAVLSNAPQNLEEAKVRATLRSLLSDVRNGARRRGEQIDGVSAFLYQSRDHITGGSSALGRAEWWPHGHSFNPGNIANINNKATYVEKIDVFFLPELADTVQRLSEDQRRAIFTELVRTQDRATREAEAKYPTDESKIPSSELKTYDFLSAMKNNMETEEMLRLKYEKELLRRFGITQQELDDIQKEAMGEQWPLPPL